MKIFGLSIGESSNIADNFAWDQYQNGYASDYTEVTIAGLNCSDEMKQKIEADVRGNNPGSVLPSEPSAWAYAFDGLWYNADINTYTNNPK